MKEKEILDINELAGGAVQEAITFALGEIFENIKDPNTQAEKARKLNITLELKPDETRQIIKMRTTCRTVLVPVNSITTQLLLDRDGNKLVAKELLKNDPNQIDFNEITQEKNVEDNNKILEMNKEA